MLSIGASELAGGRMRGRASIVVIGLPRLAAFFCFCLISWICVLPVTADAAERSETKRVLLLHSFGRDFRPWSEYARSIKASLEKDSPWPLDLQEHTLLTARFNKPGPEAPFVEYLNSLYHDQPPDIVLSLGAPAAAFVQKYRDRLFPGSPLVLTPVSLLLKAFGKDPMNRKLDRTRPSPPDHDSLRRGPGRGPEAVPC